MLLGITTVLDFFFRHSCGTSTLSIRFVKVGLSHLYVSPNTLMTNNVGYQIKHLADEMAV